MLIFINLLKTIAAILITNSHFDELYPSAYMSTGGALGNAIFFMVSGYCLSAKVKGSFTNWMLSRVKRVYLPFWILRFAFAWGGGVYQVELSNIVQLFIWPHKELWFICAILFYYALFYFLCRLSDRSLNIIIVISIITYFSIYVLFVDLTKWSVEDNGYFKYIFYFIVMLFGYKLKRKKVFETSSKGKTWIIMTGISLFLFVSLKVLLNRFEKLYTLQFLVQGATLTFAIGLFMWLGIREKTLEVRLSIWIKALLQYISSATLEIYIINMPLIVLAQRLAFPLNVVVAMVTILMLGAAIHVILDKTLFKALDRF